MGYKLLAACALSIYFLASCAGKPVDVVLDQSADDSLNHKVLVDGKTLFNLKGDTAVAVKLVPGRHFLQINDSAKREFVVPQKGGLVNLSNKEYVVYEIKYTAKGKEGSYGGATDINSLLALTGRPYKIKNAILIDSFVIFPRISNAPPADSVLMKLVPELIEKGSVSSARNDESVEGLKLIGRNQFFIEKFWDYNVTDSIPETMEVETSRYSIGNESRTKTTVMEARLFLLSIMFSDSEQYVVKSIREIREGKKDKEKVKEQESKQMKF